MVTGKVEPEESVLHALKREVFEEAGLELKKAYNVNITLFYEKSKDRVGFSANFAIFEDATRTIKISPKEHSEYRWATFEEADKLLAFSTQKENLRHIKEHYIHRNPKTEELLDL